MSTFTNSEDPDEMQHHAAFHQGLHCLLRLKRSSVKKILFFNYMYNLNPLDKHNELSQVYYIKPEGRIHLYICIQRI